MKDIGTRLVEFGHSKFGAAHGWQKRFADALGMTSANLRKYLSGELVPGNVIHQRLRDLGCDIEWLMTGDQPSFQRAGRVSDNPPEYIIKLERRLDAVEKENERLAAENETLKKVFSDEALATVMKAASKRNNQRRRTK